MKPFVLLKDVAQQFRVQSNLVGRLIKEAEEQPEKLRKARHNEQLQMDKKEAIEDAVISLLKVKTPIYRVEQVKQSVKQMTQLNVSELFVRNVMRKELRMGYRMAK